MDANDRRRRATEEASYWWSRAGLRAPAELSAAERRQYAQWLRESPLHVAEMLHLAHVHDALERFRLWDDVSTGATSADDPADDKVVALRSTRPRLDSPRVRTARSRWFAAALAAGLCAMLIGAAWLWSDRGEVYATDRAERREVMLEDGSVIRLEPQSVVRVSFRERERRLYLENGRALFQVAKDADRPFIVEAERATVRAVGTAFGVERNREGVVVTVAEGKVAVRATRETDGGPQSGPPQPAVGTARPEVVFLTAGKQVVVQRSGDAEPVRDVDTSRALAWSEGRLVFDGVPLREVAEQFNRYNRTQLLIEGEALSRRPVNGVFEASDPETLVAFISAGAQVSVTHPDRLHIVISSSR